MGVGVATPQARLSSSSTISVTFTRYFMTTDTRLRSTALVTGASSGIGMELARILAEHGHDLIVVARTEQMLQELAGELRGRYGVQVTVLVADLAQADAPRMLYDAIAERGLQVDLLINNAGFGLAGRFGETPLGRELEMVHVNVSAVTALTKLFLPPMIARRRGRVMNVASTAAFQPGPYMAVYYATKAYVLSFTEAVDEELRDTGVTLTAFCPGPTRTQFNAIAHVRKSRLFPDGAMMDARDVARAGYQAMMRGRRVAIPGFFNRLGVFGATKLSRRIATRIAGRLQHSS
jgi:short-subunit dehydrogenase